MPYQSAAGGIFPLPLLPSPLSRRRRHPSRRIEQRHQTKLLKVRLANNAITSLNNLSVSYYAPLLEQTSNSSPTAIQQRLIDHVTACVNRFIAGRPSAAQLDSASAGCGELSNSDLLSLVWSALGLRLRDHVHADQHQPSSPAGRAVAERIFQEASSSSNPSSASTAMPIIANKVALPAVAGTADLLSLLPPDVAARYRHAACADLLRSGKDTPSKLPRSRCFGSHAEYLQLVQRMRASGMLAFTRQPVVVNGLFAVAKGPDSQRLIIDARPANALFKDPAKVVLPTPDLLTKLQSDGSRPLHVAKRDLDNYYHRLRLPEWMQPYFALPAVRAGDISAEVAAAHGADTMIYPCCATLPMGWSHSVYLAQQVHEHILNTATDLSPSDRILPDTDSLLDRTRHAVYIDDLLVFGYDPAQMASWLTTYDRAMDRLAIPSKTEKRIEPTASQVEGLGLTIDGRRHEINLAPAKLWSLVRDTRAVLRVGMCTGYDMRRLLGRWIWACLPVRCSLAVLSSAFHYAERAGRRLFTVWRSVRTELMTLCDIAPLLTARVGSSWWPYTIATDASSTGCGVVASLTPSAAQQAALSGLAGRPPSSMVSPSLVATATAPGWKTIVASRWRGQEHINQLEVRSISTALRWTLSFPWSTRHRLLVLSDSAVAVGSLTKGRSSSIQLLRRLRTVAALCLASGMTLSTVWVPTHLNPADEPSRRV
jgi:hypothetical protein